MKRNLRALCLALAAAVCSVSFAQVQNVTNKMVNPDMEKGIIGWDLTFDSHVWKRQVKTALTYHGFSGVCIENWKSDATTGLTDNTISQTITDLPNGTYVFGAYAVAAVRDAVENREIVEGAYLFANEAEVAVATNWPEVTDMKWSHPAKFNVAVRVTEGTLTVGMKAVETNANFLMLDNATLYFFGETEPEAALDEMAKLDIAASVAIADTCKTHKMHADSLLYLEEQIAAASEISGAANAYEIDENVWYASRLARKSIADYRNLKAAFDAAKAVSEMEWSEAVDAAVESLKALVEECEALYEAGSADRLLIEAKIAELTEATAYVELDAAYTKMDALNEILDEMEPGDNVGDYSEEMILRIQDLIEEIGGVLGESESGLSAVTAQEMCDSLYALIQDVLDNPISYDEFPITIPRGSESLHNKQVLKGAVLDENSLVYYKSKTYSFQYPLSRIRFIVRENGSNALQNGYPYIAISEFAMYDAEGNQIELSKDMITSNACHNTINPTAPDGAGIPGLIDGNTGTFFHSAWKNGPADYHYLEVTLPEGKYNAFSFSMTARSSSELHSGQFPAVLEITYISDAITNLQAVAAVAREMHPVQGIIPGFVNYDPASFYAAVEAAEALLAADKAAEHEVNAAIETLQAEIAKANANVILPEAGKKYRIVNGGGGFMTKQGIHKAMTVQNDSTHYYQLMWETAAADSASQLFSFEVMENEEGKYYYSVKHEATGRYISDYIDADGIYTVNAFSVQEEKDTVELRPLGYGQFGIYCGEATGKTNSNQMHPNGHSSGAGSGSSVIKWKSNFNDWSAWYIREMSELPCATKSISDLKFETAPIHLYEGMNSLSIKADKECVFSDFVLYDIYGKVVPTIVSKNDTATTVLIDTAIIESFSFSFTNAEKVSEVTILGCAMSKIGELQTAYDEALAVAPVHGDEVGQVSDVSEYEAALAAAKNILDNGGSDEEILNAVALLDSALAHLKVNWPTSDKEYFILFNDPAFKEINGLDMGIFAKGESILWTYLQPQDNKFLWKFNQAGTKDGDPIYHIQNVESELYIGAYAYLKKDLPMVDINSADIMTYRIYVEGGESVIRATKWSNTYLYPKNNSNGAGVYGTVYYWSTTYGSPSVVRVVEKERYLSELIANIEDIEVVDEYVAPAAKGIYDLFGRRIEAPAATGIYIVDGKKVLVKREQK
ncbi:MAG: hypothetical protein IKY64_00610 [Bacteroidaceae bacterium]|nr:hypothetical protein [Bacteroidaceae bacterium]